MVIIFCYTISIICESNKMFLFISNSLIKSNSLNELFVFVVFIGRVKIHNQILYDGKIKRSILGL